MDTSAIIALRVHDRTLTLKQLLQRLRIDPSWAAMSRCKEDLTMECWAESLGLAADNAELQAAVTQFRRANGLFTVDQVKEWLERNGMSLDDLVNLLNPQVLRRSLARRIIPDDQIRRQFLDSSNQFDRAEISRIVMHEYGEAQELLFQVEEGSDFHDLARKYSADAATAKLGGYVGVIGRSDLEPEIAAVLFNAAAGTMLGPFEKKREYTLILVEGVNPAELNESVEEKIREQLFQNELELYQRTLEVHEDL